MRWNVLYKLVHVLLLSQPIASACWCLLFSSHIPCERGQCDMQHASLTHQTISLGLARSSLPQHKGHRPFWAKKHLSTPPGRRSVCLRDTSIAPLSAGLHPYHPYPLPGPTTCLGRWRSCPGLSCWVEGQGQSLLLSHPPRLEIP